MCILDLSILCIQGIVHVLGYWAGEENGGLPKYRTMNIPSTGPANIFNHSRPDMVHHQPMYTKH